MVGRGAPRCYDVGVNHGLRITLALALAGAIFGALAGSVIVIIVPLMMKVTPFSLFIIMGAAIGAPLGAILFPTAGWLVMRHVPIGRALVGTFVGTVLGGIAGGAFMLSSSGTSVDPRVSLSAGAVAGFLGSVLLLRLTAARTKQPTS